jgi:hypothetical protein
MSLEELERQMIREAQRELAPAAAVRERHELALLARLARDVPAGGAASGLRALGRPAPAAPWLGFSGLPGRMLGVGLALGVLMGGWVGYSLGQRRAGVERASVAGAPAAGVRDAPAPGELVGATTVTSDAVEPGEVASEPAPAGAVAVSASNEPSPAATARPPKRAVSRAPRAASSSLAEELAMLQRARRALGAGNPLLALGIVSELDERFARGVLIEERIATRVFSLCALDRVSEARAVGREFLARHPGSVYAERVRTSCIETPE